MAKDDKKEEKREIDFNQILPTVWGEEYTGLQLGKVAVDALLQVAGDKVERREITSGGGHLSGSVGWLHVGLGAAEAADVRVIWPDGSEGDWMTLPARSFQILRPGAPARAWQPG